MAWLSLPRNLPGADKPGWSQGGHNGGGTNGLSRGATVLPSAEAATCSYSYRGGKRTSGLQPTGCGACGGLGRKTPRAR